MEVFKYDGFSVPVKTWLPKAEIEVSADMQIDNCARLPFVFSHIAVMPDCHAGKGSVIGFTMLLPGLKIIPNIVSVDIGCGMLSAKLDIKPGKYKLSNKKPLRAIDESIRHAIPMGFNIHNITKVSDKILEYALQAAYKEAVNFSHKFYDKFGIKISDAMPKYDKDYIDEVIKRSGVSMERFYKSIGTLGGGNHFIELGEDEDGCYWLTIHTGSRNFGNLLAKYWQTVAIDEIKRDIFDYEKETKLLIGKLKAEGKQKKISKELVKLKKRFKNIRIPDSDLAVLTGDNAAGYFFDMIFAQQYAKLSRSTILSIITDKLDWGVDGNNIIESIHNFIDFNDMIIRKGAIASYKDQKMVIPFNMRDGLFIVEGKSNPDWNYSAPHGSGRVLSRSQAKEKLELKDFEKQMKGIYSTSVVESVLDEAPSAYKDIYEVMENQKDLVGIEVELAPLAVIKG